MCVHAFVFPRDEPAQGLARPKYTPRSSSASLRETVSPSLSPVRVTNPRQRESRKSRIINLRLPRRENIPIFSPLSWQEKIFFSLPLFRGSTVFQWVPLSLSLSLFLSLSVSSPFSNVPIELQETNPTSLDPALSANDAEIGVDRNPKQRRATVYARDSWTYSNVAQPSDYQTMTNRWSGLRRKRYSQQWKYVSGNWPIT